MSPLITPYSPFLIYTSLLAILGFSIIPFLFGLKLKDYEVASFIFFFIIFGRCSLYLLGKGDSLLLCRFVIEP